MRNAAIAAGLLAVLAASAAGIFLLPGDSHGESVGPLNWEIEDGVLAISGTGAMPNFSSSSPPWLEYNESITSVSVGEGVTKIGTNAFANLTNVRSVSLPDSLTMIENNAFSGCTSLESAVIPDNVTSPGRNTFQGCTSLTSVVYGDGAKWIGQYSFDGCTALESVTIGASVASLGDYTFRNCTSLAEIVLPEGITSIGQYCFMGCTALAHVDLPSTLQEMKYGSFSGSGLVSIVIPDSCSEVWRQSFKDCTSLTYVKYPDSITYVGVGNFMGCTALERIDFGSSVVEIRENAFSGCTSLNDAWLPESLTTIGPNAFKNCTSLTEVVLYEDVTALGNYAFQNCSSLTELTVGSNVSTVGTQAFRNCNNLATIYNASDLPLVAGSTDYGYMACYASEIVQVEPSTVTYTDSGETVAEQTAYGHDGELSFRIRPADPVKEGYVFVSWTNGGQDVGKNRDPVVIDDSEPVLAASWIPEGFDVSADEQFAVAGSTVAFAILCDPAGEYTYTLSEASGVTASVSSDGIVTAVTSEPCEASVSVEVSNGYGTESLTVPILVEPLLEFTNTPSEGTIATEVS